VELNYVILICVILNAVRVSGVTVGFSCPTLFTAKVMISWKKGSEAPVSRSVLDCSADGRDEMYRDEDYA
jgi:hypothetical protein